MLNEYELLFDHVENMVCTLNVDGRFTSINPAGEPVTGYSARELIGSLAVELVPPELKDDAVESFRRRLAGESSARPDESVLVRRDGTRVPIEVTSTVFLDGERTAGVLAVIYDVSEQKKAQEALLQSERRFRRAFESAAIGMALVDIEGRFLEVNDSLCKSVGYPADELVRKTFQEITHPDDLDLDLEYLGRLLRGAISSYQLEKRYFDAAGAIVLGLLSVSLVRSSDGTPLHFVSQIEDITQRKRAEAERDRLQEQLHHAQKLEAVGRLAGGIAHDFNNMLTGIRGYTELLLDGLDHSSPLREDAEQIKRAAEQASNLPKQLLAFSREQVLEPRLVDLDAVVDDAVGMVRRLVGGSVEVVVQHEATSALVEADPSEFEQLLLNLAANAGHAMPEGGRLVIRTTNEELDGEAAASAGVEPGSYVVLSVSDTGVGMDAATKARVFEPFFTTRPLGEGSGLGLAGVYGVVSQSGGFVRLETEVAPAAPSSSASRAPRHRRSRRAPPCWSPKTRRSCVISCSRRWSARATGCSSPPTVTRRSASAPRALIPSMCSSPNGDARHERWRTRAAGARGQPSTPVVFMSGYTTEAVPAGLGADPTAACSRSRSDEALVERVEAALASGATSEAGRRPSRPRR